MGNQKQAEFKLEYIGTEDIDFFWDAIKPLFKASCDAVPTMDTPETFYEQAKEGKLRLWRGLDNQGNLLFAAAVGESTLKDKKMAEIKLLGGHNMPRWIDFLAKEFERLALKNGVHTIRIHGRPGWQKVMKKYDYHKTVVVLDKELDYAG